MNRSLLWSLIFLAVFMNSELEGKIVSETVLYQQGETVLEGYRVRDDRFDGRKPGVLVVHDWKGLTEKTKKRADQLASLGYVVFAADVYGKGIRPKDNTEAAKVAGSYKSNVALLRERINAALDVLKKSPGVDPDKTAAIGYCFGGTTVLELARSGALVTGVVSFHGGLGTPKPEDAKNIKAKVLVLHGADDPLVIDEVHPFENEMRAAKVDWQMISYGGAVHSFTDPSAGNNPSTGVAYHRQADERSWRAMKDFFNEIFSADR
jgi:dienelactone hydrolase